MKMKLVGSQLPEGHVVIVEASTWRPTANQFYHYEERDDLELEGLVIDAKAKTLAEYEAAIAKFLIATPRGWNGWIGQYVQEWRFRFYQMA